MTNVPGMQHPIYLAGKRIVEMAFWVPQSGGIGLGVSILSYDGRIHFGVITDEGLVPALRNGVGASAIPVTVCQRTVCNRPRSSNSRIEFVQRGWDAQPP